MKKSILIFVALFAATFANAQSIISDEVKSSGLRMIVGDAVAARDMKDQHVFFVGLSAIQKDSIEKWFLSVKVIEWNAYDINKGNVLLIKTINDETIKLVAEDHYDATVRDVHTQPFVYSDYSTTALYPISEEDIIKISTGVKKIRQEVGRGDTHDKDYKKDKIGAIIKEEYRLISNALQTKKDIYDGF